MKGQKGDDIMKSALQKLAKEIADHFIQRNKEAQEAYEKFLSDDDHVISD